MFLVLEGIDGGGKTTQARLLKAELERRGRAVVHVHEPGATPLGEKIRAVLLSRDAGVEIGARAEALLYSAARAQLVQSVLTPALAAGQAIVCERYYYSTLAYQGYGLSEDPGELATLSTWATAGLEPDRVVVLDLEPRAGLGRVGGALDRIEARGVEYLERVREGYRRLAAADPVRFRIVDAARPPQEVHRSIVKVLADVLP